MVMFCSSEADRNIKPIIIILNRTEIEKNPNYAGSKFHEKMFHYVTMVFFKRLLVKGGC